MNKVWICLAFLAGIGNIVYAYEQDDWYNWEEYNFDSPEYEAVDTKDDSKSAEETNSDGDNIFTSKELDKEFDIEEYQIEDNRSELSEESFDNVENDTGTNDTRTEKEIAYFTSKEISNLGIDVNSLNNNPNSMLFQGSTKSDADEQNVETPLTIEKDIATTNKAEFDNKIFEDTKAILGEETDNDFTEDNTIDLDTSKISNLTQITEETTRLLEETHDTIEEESKNDQSQKSNEDDTVDAAFEDLLADLNKLHKTWGKLNDFDDNDQGVDILNDNIFSEASDDYEKIKIADEKNEVEQSQVVSTTTFDDFTLQIETKPSNQRLYLNDALPASESELVDLEVDKNNGSSTTTETILSKQKLILRDALVPIEESNTIELKEVTQTTTNINDLSSTELDELTKKFSAQLKVTEITANDIRNANNISLMIDSHAVVTSPNYPHPYPTNKITDWMFSGDGVGIELIITNFSVDGENEDYLLFKPGGKNETGSTGLLFSYTLRSERRYRFLDVDKMFVRFVATARESTQKFTGFTFYVRMVAPRPVAPEPEPEPEPGIPAPPETITLNMGGLSLEGFLQIEEKFRQIIADMADMYIHDNNIDPGMNTTSELTQITSRALCFHNWPKFELCVEVSFGVPLIYDDDEEREPRLNATDLTKMWETYSREIFAARLAALGITEYQVPNDRAIVTVWLLIAGGVVISMAMLAFASWRFSCFEDYSRMPSFSDTDSVIEKRNLDLFPTPHQPLPPIYNETDYKWADAKNQNFSKVEIGGYTNNSYVREDLYAFDSDEEIVPANVRNTSFSPRDLYSV